MHRITALLLLSGLLSGAVARAGAVKAVPQGPVSPCRDRYKPADLFHPGRGTRVVVAQQGEGGPSLGEAIEHFAQQELGPQVKKTGLRPEDLQVARVQCPVKSHDEARELGRAWGADLLLWGEPAGKSVTLVRWRGPEDGGTTDAPDLRSAMELGGPAPEASPPLALLHLVLGLYAYRSQHYGMAARYLEESRDEASTEQTAEPIQSLIGTGYVMALQGEKGMAALTDAGRRCPKGPGHCQPSSLHNLAWGTRRTGDRARALMLYQEALPLRQDDPAGTAMTLNNLGLLRHDLGEPEEANKLLGQARAAAQKAGNPRWEALVLCHAGVVHLGGGDRNAALAEFQKAQQIAHDGGYVYGEIVSLNLAGSVHRLMGQTDQALLLHEQALKQAQATDGPLVGDTLHHIGLCHAARGKYREALTLYLQALELLPQDGDVSLNAAALSSTAEAYRELGESGKARRFYREALFLVQETDRPAARAALLSDMGLLYMQTREPKLALKSYKEALPLLADRTQEHARAVTLHLLSQAAASVGDMKQALHAQEEAVQLAEQAKTREDLPAYQADLGEVLGQLGRASEAIERYRRAATLYFQQHDDERAAGCLDQAFRLSLRDRQRGEGEKIIAELREHHMDLFVSVKEAQLLNLTGPKKRAEDAYQKLRMLAEQLPPDQADTFSSIAAAGLSRLQHPGPFGHCLGVVAIKQVDQIRPGDILLRFRKTCLSHVLDLEALSTSTPRSKKVPLRVLRRGRSLTINATPEGLDRAVTDF